MAYAKEKLEMAARLEEKYKTMVKIRIHSGFNQEDAEYLARLEIRMDAAEAYYVVYARAEGLEKRIKVLKEQHEEKIKNQAKRIQELLDFIG